MKEDTCSDEVGRSNLQSGTVDDEPSIVAFSLELSFHFAVDIYQRQKTPRKLFISQSKTGKPIKKRKLFRKLPRHMDKGYHQIQHHQQI
jgi:hypothetical protein